MRNSTFPNRNVSKSPKSNQAPGSGFYEPILYTNPIFAKFDRVPLHLNSKSGLKYGWANLSPNGLQLSNGPGLPRGPADEPPLNHYMTDDKNTNKTHVASKSAAGCRDTFEHAPGEI